MNKRYLKISLMAMALLQMGALAVTSGIADIARAFPDVSVTSVQLLTTLPILVQTPVTLLSSYLNTRFSRKSLFIAAILFYLVGGLSPYFIHDFTFIVVMRCLYGGGIGLEIPLVAGTTVQYFEGRERASLMGVCGAVEMLGGMFYTYAGGTLSAIGLRRCIPDFRILL